MRISVLCCLVCILLNHLSFQLVTRGDILFTLLLNYPVPVFLLAQMAIRIDDQGKGLGKITLIKSLEYLWKVNRQMTAYAIVVDCLNENVKQFYEKYGFEILCEYNGKTRMYLSMKVLKNLFSQPVFISHG